MSHVTLEEIHGNDAQPGRAGKRRESVTPPGRQDDGAGHDGPLLALVEDHEVKTLDRDRAGGAHTFPIDVTRFDVEDRRKFPTGRGRRRFARFARPDDEHVALDRLTCRSDDS